MNRNLRQPSLADLTGRLLQAQALGGATDSLESEVEPHEVLNSFRVEPRTAWLDAVLPLKLFGIKELPTSTPPEWAAVSSADLGAVAVPMAAGHFPQRVRDLETLFTTDDLTVFLPQPAPTAEENLISLRNWSLKQQGESGIGYRLLGRGVARLIGASTATQMTSESAASANEVAASLWTTGRCEEALAMWLAQPDHPVVSFNRGMGLLFLGRAAEALPHLRVAAEQLPDLSGWSHLARLYLALAEARA